MNQNFFLLSQDAEDTLNQALLGKEKIQITVFNLAERTKKELRDAHVIFTDHLTAVAKTLKDLKITHGSLNKQLLFLKGPQQPFILHRSPTSIHTLELTTLEQYLATTVATALQLPECESLKEAMQNIVANAATPSFESRALAHQ